MVAQVFLVTLQSFTKRVKFFEKMGSTGFDSEIYWIVSMSRNDFDNALKAKSNFKRRE